MGIKYEKAEDIQNRVNELALMMFPHVKLDSVVCLRSFGSSSRGTIARCHALGKAMQLALGRKGFYVIEVINKRFDRMSEVDQTKTLIHELMHIPKTFGGGFIHHDIVHEGNVERMYQHYCNMKRKNNFGSINQEVSGVVNDDSIYSNSIEDDNLTPGQRIEREFFVVLDKPVKKIEVRKKKNWWF